jgi:hypothetical protein
MGKPIAARTTLQPAAQHAMSTSHKVKLVLRRGIVTGTIPGGTRLVQTSIASEMEVGARQVRDALRELAAAARAAALATTEIMLQAAGLLVVMETETDAALWAERNSTFHDLNDVYVTADGIVCAVDRSGCGLYLVQFEGAWAGPPPRAGGNGRLARSWPGGWSSRRVLPGSRGITGASQSVSGMSGSSIAGCGPSMSRVSITLANRTMQPRVSARSSSS